MSVSTAINILATRTLRWSSPLVFNDPFDVTDELRLNFTEEEASDALNERLILFIEEGRSLNQNANQTLRSLMAIIGRAGLDKQREITTALRNESFPATSGQVQSREDLQETWRKMAPDFRILCLSESNDVMPMWLHYADTYKGVVMEFEAVDVTESPLLIARAVDYLDSTPALADAKKWVDFMLGEISQYKLFDDYFYLKTKEWSYEKEWRIVSHANENESGLFSDYSFNYGDLNRIYFGPDSPENDKKEISSMLIHDFDHVSTCSGLFEKSTSKIIFPD